MLPGISGGLLKRMAPPPFSEYAKKWISPLGVDIGGRNFHPMTFAAHAFVAGGSLLARSVCVIHPYKPGVGSCFSSFGRDSFAAVCLALTRFDAFGVFVLAMIPTCVSRFGNIVNRIATPQAR